jgi:hypothetical protein
MRSLEVSQTITSEDAGEKPTVDAGLVGLGAIAVKLIDYK